MRGIRLLATDLDGTVLYEEEGAGSRLTPRTTKALQALQASGTVVALASGRMHESMAKIAGHLGLTGPIISYNGAMLRMPDGQGGWAEPSFHRPLDAQVAAEVIEVCQERGVALHYYLGGKLYARKFSPWWDIYEGRTASPMQAMESLLPLRGTEPTKMLIFAEPATVLALRDELAPKLAGRAELVITHDEYLEFMRPGVNKGQALKALASLLGLQRAQVAAAGDGNNDVEMLQAAGLAIGISNGREALRACATVLVDPPEQDGLARFIEEELL